MVELRVGEAAPVFSLEDDGGQLVELVALRGRPVVLFFYPEDDTPGCTAQACGYRDDHAAFAGLGAEVFGVSPDGVESHARFRAKHAFPFRLLSDPGSRVAAAYGAYGEKLLYGKRVVGTIRSSVVIGADGRVAHVARNVRTEGNGRRMLEALRRIVAP